MTAINTTLWERSSVENWESPTPNSLKMKVNLNHDYIVSDVDYANYTLSSNVSVVGTNDDDGLGVVFDYIDSKNYKYIMYQGGGLGALSSRYLNAPVSFVEVKNGVFTVLKRSTVVPYWAKNSKFNIKVENIFGDINFYVNNVLAMKSKKDDAIKGKIGFITHSQITNFNDIVIEQSLTNRVVAKYVLYAVSSNEQLTEIEARQYDKNDIFTEITPKVSGVSKHNVDINIMYRSNSDILTEIQPYGHTNFETEIEVRPHNKMWAMYEVQQPPIISDVNNSIMDAFVRSEGVYSTVNNGSGISMVVGKLNNEVWNSYIKFDVSHILSSLPILSSKLRLYYSGSLPQLNLELFEVKDTWGEYSVTYLNSPDIGRMITTDYTQNITQRYIELDVSDIALEWLSNPTKNQGFYLKASDSSPDGQMIFRTRESMQQPELIINHYSTDIFSTGRSDAMTEISAMKAGKSDHNAEVEVSSAFAFDMVDSEIYCHRPEVPIDVDINIEITSNKVYEYSELTVSIVKESDLATEVSVISDIRISSMDAEISVSRPFGYVEIYSSNLNDKVTQITVSHDKVLSEISVSSTSVLTEIYLRYIDCADLESFIDVSNSKVLSEISVSSPNVLAEIYLRHIDYNDLDTIITVSHDKVFSEIFASSPFVLTEVSSRAMECSDADAVIIVTNDVILAEIDVVVFSDVETEIEIVGIDNSDILTEINVSNYIVEAEVTVRVIGKIDHYTEVSVSRPIVYVEIRTPEQSNIETEIDVQPHSSKYTAITVSRDTVLLEIKTRAYGESDVNTEIYVKNVVDIELEITAKSVSQIPVSIDVKVTSNVESMITVSNDRLFVELIPRVIGESEVTTELLPRISTVDNVEVTLTVGGGKRAYGFVM